MTLQVLVVDDEPAMRNVLTRVLRSDGYGVMSAANGKQALDLIRREAPDLLLLDYHLPDMTGDAICRRIRRHPLVQDLPVIMLTGDPTSAQPVVSLDSGADDYLQKPFDLLELLARVRALLRRTKRWFPRKKIVEKGDIRIDLLKREVTWAHRRVPALAPKEFDLLKTLVMNSPAVIAKETLALQVWRNPLRGLHERTLDVHVRRIRRKLGPTAAACLKTIPAIGFQWKV
jgi:DNA-binding response OmpR family regulator